jgi:hypothetical protein
MLPRQDLSLTMYKAMQASGFAAEAPIYQTRYIYIFLMQNKYFKLFSCNFSSKTNMITTSIKICYNID